jgi:trimeric autotransporter adhesin
MLMKKKALLATALTSASLAAFALPTSAWARANANTTADCAEAIEGAGDNTAAIQVDANGAPVLDANGVPVLVAANGLIPNATQCGVGSRASGNNSSAIGANANVSEIGGTAIGAGASVFPGAANAVAIGSDSVATEVNTVSVGNATLKRKLVNVANGTADSDAATVGQLKTATAFVAVDRTIFGKGSVVGTGTDAVALGAGAVAAGQNSVAIGNGSVTGSSDDNVVSFGRPADAAANITAITRRLTNVANGTAATDAVNRGQLDGSFTNTNTDLVNVIDGRISTLGVGGAGNAFVDVNPAVVLGVPSVAADASVAGSVAIGGAAAASAAGAVAVGEGAKAAGSKGTAIGSQASAELTNSTALGSGAKVTATAENSVALGAGSIATEANMVSIGSGKVGDAFATRRLTNVTAGVADTDAVNAGQLNAVKNDLKKATDDIGILKSDVLALKNVASTGASVGGFLAVKPATGAAAAVADKDGAIALGGNAVASTENAVAIGTGATAKDGAAVSIGLGNTASGNGAVAIGDPNTATGQGAVALGFTNTATGLAAVALGSESQAVGDSAFAQGAKAKAIGFSALALGDGAVAELQVVSNPPSNPAEPNPSANIAIGLGAKAIAQTTIAIGNLAVANAEDATVVGDKSQAGFHATAIGGEVIASGRGSQAFGWQTNATGNLSTALGFKTNAVGTSSLAVGANARADGASASAVGAGATANFANSTAIGTGAVTTRADQIVLGRKAVTANGVTTPGTSVTIADIAASTAAQSGPTDVMTVDAFGTIGRDPSIRASIASLNTLTAKHTADIATLFDLNDENRRQIGKANEGVAMGLAMETPALPADAKFGLSGGVGYYNNASAASMAATARVSEKATISAGLGVGFETGEVGARGGFQVVW